jgi:hypothetical protein
MAQITSRAVAFNDGLAVNTLDLCRLPLLKFAQLLADIFCGAIVGFARRFGVDANGSRGCPRSCVCRKLRKRLDLLAAGAALFSLWNLRRLRSLGAGPRLPFCIARFAVGRDAHPPVRVFHGIEVRDRLDDAALAARLNLLSRGWVNVNAIENAQMGLASLASATRVALPLSILPPVFIVCRELIEGLCSLANLTRANLWYAFVGHAVRVTSRMVRARPGGCCQHPFGSFSILALSRKRGWLK